MTRKTNTLKPRSKLFLERKTPLKKLKIPGQIHKICPNKNLPQSKAVEVFAFIPAGVEFDKNDATLHFSFYQNFLLVHFK